MTCQALHVVGVVLSDKILMRVMAGYAANAGISPVKALAVGQSIRLEAHIDFTSPAASHNRFPGSVTLAAKVRGIFRREFSQIWRSGVGCFTLEGCRKVGERSVMTVLAGDAWLKRLEVQLPLRYRTRLVAAETVLRLTFPELSSHSFFQSLRG